MLLALCNSDESVVSFKYISPIPLVSTSDMNGAIRYLLIIGNGAGLKVGYGALNEITPFVLTC